MSISLSKRPKQLPQAGDERENRDNKIHNKIRHLIKSTRCKVAEISPPLCVCVCAPTSMFMCVCVHGGVRGQTKCLLSCLHPSLACPRDPALGSPSTSTCHPTWPVCSLHRFQGFNSVRCTFSPRALYQLSCLPDPSLLRWDFHKIGK